MNSSLRFPPPPPPPPPCKRHSQPTKELYVDLRPIPEGVTRCCQLHELDNKQKLADQTIDRRKVTQLNLLHQESVDLPATCRVYLRDGSAQALVRAATLRKQLQINLSVSPSHRTLTSGQPVLAVTLTRRVAGRVATRVLACK